MPPTPANLDDRPPPAVTPSVGPLVWLVAAADVGLMVSDFVVRPLITSGDAGPALRSSLVLAALVAAWLWPHRREPLVPSIAPPPHSGSPLDRCLGSLAGAPAAPANVLAIHVSEHVAEVFWDGPPPNPAAPWTASREGWVWDAPISELEAARPRPGWLGAVVELGETRTGTLWLHLGGFRRIGTSGDGAGRPVGALLLDEVRARGGPDLDVLVLGDPLGTPPRDADQPAVEEVLAALWRRAARRHPSRRRRPAGPTGHVIVFAAATDPSTPRVVDAARGDPDSTLVIVGSAANDELVLGAADGRITVSFLSGVTVSNRSLPSPDGVDQRGNVVEDEARTREPAATAAARACPTAGVEIRVLGPVEAIGSARPLAGKGLELVTYLATHPDGVVDQRIRAALWPDRAPTPYTWANRVSTTRKALGVEPDGSARLRRFRQHVGRVAPTVRTDLARLIDAQSSFRAEPSDDAAAALTDALGAVRGRPFDTRSGYRWAHDELHVSQAARAVVDAAHQLAERALDRGDLEHARWCTRQGLLACPEDDLLQHDRRRTEHSVASRRRT